MTVMNEQAAQAILDGFICPLDGQHLVEKWEYDGDESGVHCHEWYECAGPDHHYWHAANNAPYGSMPVVDEAADRYPDRIKAP